MQRTESATMNSFNTAKLTKVQCNFNPEWIKNDECRLKAINRNKQELTVKGELIKPLKNFWVHAESFKLYSGYRRFIVTYDFNLCDAFRKAKRSLMLKSAMEAIAKFTNINHSCPYTGQISFKSGYVINDMVHLVIPPGRYRADIKITDGFSPEPVAFLQLFADIDERSNKSITKRRNTYGHN